MDTLSLPRLMLVCCLLAGTPAALADIYRCTLADGSVQFTDAACASGSTERVLLQENTPLDSTAARANQAAYEQARAAREATGQPEPKAFLIRDTATEAWNAALTAESEREEKQRKKKKKKKKKSRKKRAAAR